jgi:hypothetical protein
VTYTYDALAPLEQNLERFVPLIIHDKDTKEKYQDYVSTELLKYQNFSMKDTKRLIIAFHSMMIVAYRMAPPGGKACDWVREHCMKKLTRYVECPSGLCFWVCVALSELETTEKRTHDHSVVARAKEVAEKYYGKLCKGVDTNVGLEEIKNIAEKMKISVCVYEAEKRKVCGSIPCQQTFLY